MRATITSWLLLVALTTTAAAGDMARIGNVTIHDPWARASLGTSKTSAVYMTLEIEGEQADRLVAAETPLAERAEMHTNVMDGGVARMRPVDAVELAPGTPSALRPGGLHIMLTGLKDELVEGATLPLTLTFEKAGSVQIEVPVLGLAAGMRQGDRHGAHHGAAGTH
jgi:periplasmic copper chaperone A